MILKLSWRRIRLLTLDLVQVHMVQGIDAGILARHAAQQLLCPVGENLVHVHVGGGSGPALQGIHNKRFAQTARGHLAAGLGNGLDLRVRQGGPVRFPAIAAAADDPSKVWTLPDGRYSPAIAVRSTILIVGREMIYGFTPS